MVEIGDILVWENGIGKNPLLFKVLFIEGTKFFTLNTFLDVRKSRVVRIGNNAGVSISMDECRVPSLDFLCDVQTQVAFHEHQKIEFLRTMAEVFSQIDELQPPFFVSVNTSEGVFVFREDLNEVDKVYAPSILKIHGESLTPYRTFVEFPYGDTIRKMRWAWRRATKTEEKEYKNTFGYYVGNYWRHY